MGARQVHSSWAKLNWIPIQEQLEALLLNGAGVLVNV